MYSTVSPFAAAAGLTMEFRDHVVDDRQILKASAMPAILSHGVTPPAPRQVNHKQEINGARLVTGGDGTIPHRPARRRRWAWPALH